MVTIDGHDQVMSNPYRKEVGVAELKSHLSEYLRQVRSGESIVILDRDRPIARLVPYEDEHIPLIIRKATGDHREWVAPPPQDLGGLDAVEILLELRGER